MQRENNAVTTLKLWLFPSLVSIIGMFIWAEIKEIKSDVKALLAQANQDKIRIENLERQVFGDHNPTTASLPFSEKYPPAPIRFMMSEFIPAKNEFEEEEEA